MSGLLRPSKTKTKPQMEEKSALLVVNEEDEDSQNGSLAPVSKAKSCSHQLKKWSHLVHLIIEIALIITAAVVLERLVEQQTHALEQQGDMLRNQTESLKNFMNIMYNQLDHAISEESGKILKIGEQVQKIKDLLSVIDNFNQTVAEAKKFIQELERYEHTYVNWTEFNQFENAVTTNATALQNMTSKNQQDIMFLNNSITKIQSGAWTSLSTGVPVTFESMQKYDLNKLSIPMEARQVLVYIMFGATSCTPEVATGTFTIWSQEGNNKSLSVTSNRPTPFIQTVNSDNFWLPIGADRTFYVEFVANYPFTPACGVGVALLGWR